MAIRPVAIDLHARSARRRTASPGPCCCCRTRCVRPHRIDAGFEQLPADLERPRRDARVVERAGVGEDRQVDVRRDLARSAARRAPRIRSNTISPHAAADESNQLMRAVPRVARMVIDVDDEEAIEARDAGARQVAALHDDRGVEIARRRGRAIWMSGTPGNAMSGGGAASLLTTVDLLAERAQRVRHRQLRSDRVAVGPRVGREHEALPRGESRRRSRWMSGGLLVVVRHRCRAARRAEARAGSARSDPGRRSTRRR